MLKRIALMVFTTVLLISGLNILPINKVEAADTELNKIVDFQSDVNVVVENAIKKEFKKKYQSSPTDIIDVVDMEALEDQATYYYDNSDVDNLKVVFLVDKDSAPEMQRIRKELQENLGAKVQFKKAKRSARVLRNLTKRVADFMDVNHKEGTHGIGWNQAERESCC